MKVKVVNRRRADAGVPSSGKDNIFHQISDFAHVRSAHAARIVPSSAQVLRPSAFLPYGDQKVGTKAKPQQTGVSCVAADSVVITQMGPMLMQALGAGDMVLTRDNGFQPILWAKAFTDAQATCNRVEIQSDTIRDGIPKAPLQVSGRQGILLTCSEIARQFGSAEVLVRAGDLLHLDGVDEAQGTTPCVAVLLPQHELINANGIWVESFVPDTQAMSYLKETERRQIKAVLPGLSDLPVARSYPAARTVLRAEFARQFSR